jgi:hypothetical protein
MKKIILAAALILLSGCYAYGQHHPGPAPGSKPHQANAWKGHGPAGTHRHNTHWNRNFDPRYHLKNGFKFAGGYYYKGYKHLHWTGRYWNTTYGSWFYFDPCVRSYYYYCLPDAAWYPVTYCPYGIYTWAGCPAENDPDTIPPGQ